jgi:hypothetical protein
MEGYANAIQNAIFTPNEVREMEDRPSMPGGDELYLQQNMADLDSIDSISAANDPTQDDNDDEE